MSPEGRHVERSAITAFVPVAILIPFWLLALAGIWSVARIVIDVPFWWWPVGWLLLGGLLFLPAVQVLVLSPLLRARRPTAAEQEVIAPLWNGLVERAQLDSNSFALRVIDSDELNAYACGGHLVVVTRFAIEQLSSRQLAGVLAHELSHHLGWHTAALTIGHWLSLPVLLLARVGFFLQNVARAATGAFAANSPALTALGTMVAMLLTAVSWVFLAALYASDALGNVVGHGSEYEADRRAVRMGYGRSLAEALRLVIALGGGQRTVGWRARLSASHPPARTRVARIEAMLRHPSR